MGEHRVICAGAVIDEELVRTIADALRAKTVSSITIHKPMAVFEDSDGRMVVVGSDGEPRLLGVHAHEGLTTC
jgi:hypothetical protein